MSQFDLRGCKTALKCTRVPSEREPGGLPGKPVAARGLVSGRGPRAQRSGRNGAKRKVCRTTRRRTAGDTRDRRGLGRNSALRVLQFGSEIDMPYNGLQGMSTSLPRQEEHREKSQSRVYVSQGMMDFAGELQNHFVRQSGTLRFVLVN